MVVFSCNICGESVKKPAVSKHYNTKCRGAPISVSCMDCQKDFKGEEYAEHTSCITEAEKYSGKDYVPKPSQNAGLKKQQCWLEIVRSLLSDTDIPMSGDVRRTLQRLQSYDNVPRKQQKFINFVVNSLRIRHQQAEPVWKVVEVALEKYKEVRFGPKKADKEKSKNGVENEKSEEINGHSEGAANRHVDNKKDKKKKKKDKHEHTEDNEINEPVEQESTNEVPKKKKKKSKDKENGHDESIAENGIQSTEENAEKSKKKNKRSNDAENVVPNGIELVQNGGQDNDGTPPKKKKKKTSEPIEAANETTEVDLDTTTQSPQGPFDWTHEIYSLVEKKNEIEVEKLKSKVLKKYKKIHQIDAIPWKVEKTFNKKLKKSGLLIVDNIVKSNSK